MAFTAFVTDVNSRQIVGWRAMSRMQFRVETGIPVFFADSQGTDLSRWSAEELEAIAHALNTRPRKTLG